MYCTLDDIKKKIPEEILLQLTDDAGLGVIDESLVDAAIAEASALVDGYCAARYSLPFAVAPQILKPVAVDIAVYTLYSRRVEVMPEVRTDSFKNAVKLLTDISKGAVTLGAEAVGTGSAGASPLITSSERIFGRDRMRGL